LVNRKLKGGREMKKLISISLVLVLAGGLILAENKRADAMDPATAAVIATSFFFLPVLSAISHEHDHYRPAAYYPGTYPGANYYGAYYDAPYRARTRVYYSVPRYEGYYGRNWNRGYGYERDYRSHRGYREDRGVRYYGRHRYAGRHYR
jgi:hypothetical protein